MDKSVIPLMRRRRSWMILRIAGYVVLAILIAALFIRIHANLRWETMLKRREGRIREAESRDASRPLLRGTALPGNAWDDYRKALDLLDDLWPNFELTDLVVEKELDAETKEAILAKSTPVLSLFSQGTKRSQGQFATDWQDGYRRWRGLARGPMGEDLLCLLAFWRAESLEAKHKFRESAETFLDLCQFGRDSDFNTTYRMNGSGTTAYLMGLGGVLDLIMKGRLTTDDLVSIGHELEILESSLPPFAYLFLNESLWLPTRCLEIDKLGGSFDGDDTLKHKSWKHMFSLRLMLVEGAAYAERVMLPAIDSDSMSWRDVRATFQSIKTELQSSNNVLGADPGTYTLRKAEYRRAILARIRLLRIACTFKTTGDVSDFADPFGDKMLSARDGTRLKVWSVGANGIDDGGVGTWKDEEALDLVIECQR